jgi:hypothetical protein
MPIELRWITTPSGLVLWAHVLVAWAVVHYALFSGDPTGQQELSASASDTRSRRRSWAMAVRAILLAGTAFLLAGLGWTALLLAGFSGLMGAVLPAARGPCARKRMGAEWEVLVTVTFAFGSAWIIAGCGLELSNALFSVPLSPGRLAVVCLGGSIVLLVGPGGTHIVRGVLDKVGTLPRTRPAGGGDEVDTAEYNRGRVIGNLERVLLVAMAVVGSYEAMGLIIAAKGLIRIKEFEHRDFAEYFLVGTLTSVTVAVVAGWLLRAAVARLW